MSTSLFSNKLNLTLYSTSACHLCEQAEKLLQQFRPGLSFTKIDIADDDTLIERYGVHIPVLLKTDENGNKSELFWPFDKNKITSFLMPQK